MDTSERSCASLEVSPTISRFRLSLVREGEFPYGEVVTRCSSPRHTTQFLSRMTSDYPQEKLGAVYLDTRHTPIGFTVPFSGTLDRSSVEPRQLLAAGLLMNASSLILFHNHPSGDPAPSLEDRTFTKRMEEAGKVVGIRLVDHIILGHNRHFSFKEQGLLSEI